MRRLLRLALEDDSEVIAPGEEQEEIIIEPHLEEDLLGVEHDIDFEHVKAQTLSEAMESFYVYREQVDYLIATESCTAQTLGLLSLGVQEQLHRFNERLSDVSLESDDLIRQHQLVLEGFREALDRIAQNWVVSHKHVWNALADVFRGVDSQLTKYENKLTTTEAEYHGKQHDFQESHHKVSLTQLWYFFRTDKGQAKDIIPALTKDLALSSYVLETYSKDLLDLLKKLNSVVSGAKLNNEANVKKFLKSMESLQHPADLFKKSYLGGKPYFNVTGLEIKHGRSRHAVTVDGVVFDRLANLASSRSIIESGSMGHVALKVGAQTGYGSLAATFASAEIDYDSDDIGKVIKDGRAYLQHVHGYLNLGSKFRALGDEFCRSYGKLLDTVDGEFHAKAALGQVEQYWLNILHCFQVPAVKEMARSIRGAKYCNYLALRMLYSAR